jgi:hypothetical protein
MNIQDALAKYAAKEGYLNVYVNETIQVDEDF